MSKPDKETLALAKEAQKSVAERRRALDEEQALLDNYQPSSNAICRRVSEVEARPIEWLWPGRIARGKITVVAGHPGLGKSQVTMSLIATTTRAGQWPAKHQRSELGSALILSAEDDIADTIRPRLEAAGADVSKVLVLEAVRGEEGSRAFSLQTDLIELDQLLAENLDVSLVVIDPISAYMAGTDSHKNAEVRALLTPLSDLAARRGVAVVLVTHFNKGASTNSMMKVIGSIGLVAAARAAYAVTRDPADPSRRLFLPMKNNLGTDESGLAFSVQAHQLSNGIETSRVVWEPHVVNVSVDEVLASADEGNRDAMGEARHFLECLLETGPVPAKRVYAEAQGAGIARITLQRAKTQLGIHPRKRAFDKGWEWCLPAKVIKESEDDQGDHTGEMSTLDEDDQGARVSTLSTLGVDDHLRGETGADL